MIAIGKESKGTPNEETASLYAIAVANGFLGTIEQFGASLIQNTTDIDFNAYYILAKD